MVNRYFNYPGDIAAALRALADDFDALPPAERLPDTAVLISVQACQHDGTPAERIAAVDAVAFAALGRDATTQPMSTGGYMHRVDHGYRTDGLEIAAYTAVPAPVAAVAA